MDLKKEILSKFVEEEQIPTGYATPGEINQQGIFE